MPKEKKAKIEKRNGVTLTPWDGHKVYKWRVFFTVDGKRRNRGFKTKSGKDGAQYFADRLRGDIASDGTRHKGITDDERRAVMAFREIVDSLPAGATKPTLGEIVETYRKQAAVRRRSMTVRDLIDRYLVALDKRKLSDSYRYTIRKRLDRFEADHGEWIACDVSTEVAGDWLHDIELSPTSVNHFRAALCQLFNFGLKIKAVEENPILAIDKLKGVPSEVGILTPEQAAGLLAHSPDEILPAVAIGFFAGLRRSEISRLDWSEIDFEQGHVEVKARNTKSAARRLVPMRDCLREWLAPHRQRKGSVMPTEAIYRSRLDHARTASGIKEWPFNCLRHSFASYNLAAFENAPALAGEMGHESTKMIFKHYRALVTPAKAKVFWSISPESHSKVTEIHEGKLA
jgi:integrase